MYHEDVIVKKGETVSGIGAEYGYKASDWRKVWDDPKNAVLVRRRGKPEHLQVGDTLWVKIPWHTVKQRRGRAADSGLVERGVVKERVVVVGAVDRVVVGAVAIAVDGELAESALNRRHARRLDGCAGDERDELAEITAVEGEFADESLVDDLSQHIAAGFDERRKSGYGHHIGAMQGEFEINGCVSPNFDHGDLRGFHEPSHLRRYLILSGG